MFAADVAKGIDMSLSEKLEAARVALGKRKEWEGAVLAKADPVKSARAGNNKLLAGNLAHEFLTHGMLLGRRIELIRHVGLAPAPRAEPELGRRYAEVSWLLMNNGAHITRVVNPTQLGRWLQTME